MSNSELPTQSEGGLPIIKVDRQHDFVFTENHAGENPPIVLRYEITAGDGFVLDVSGYDFTKAPSRYRAFRITRPNSISVGIRFYDGMYKTNYYYVDWVDNQILFPLTTKTLLPEEGAKPFTGFKSGQSIIIAVGHFDRTFYPFWGSGADIK